jgi:hypothetical protein
VAMNDSASARRHSSAGRARIALMRPPIRRASRWPSWAGRPGA